MQLPPQPTYFPYYGHQFEAYVGHRCYNSWHRRPAKYRAAEAIEWHTRARLGPYLGSWTHFYVAAWAHICAAGPISARLSPYLHGWAHICAAGPISGRLHNQYDYKRCTQIFFAFTHTYKRSRARKGTHVCICTFCRQVCREEKL